MQTLPDWLGFSDSRINLNAQHLKQFQSDWKSVEEDDWLMEPLKKTLKEFLLPV